MSLAAALLAPLALLLPAAGPVRAEPAATVASPSGMTPLPFEQIFPAFDPADAMIFHLIAESFRVESEDQVRIEQHVTIRITPLAPAAAPNMLVDLPQRETGPRFAERNMGKCFPAAGIAGVQANGGNRLLLFMRDQRIVSAELERACSARDFYSGFYVARSTDGNICVKRDALLSRSGANCKLSKIKQLVELGN
jgi:hypothetical protein